MRQNDIVRFVRSVEVGKVVVRRNTRARVLKTPSKFSGRVFLEVEGFYQMKVELPKSEVVRLGVGR